MSVVLHYYIVQCIRSDNSEQRTSMSIKRANCLAEIKTFHKKGFKKYSIHRLRFMGNWVYNAYVSDCLESRSKTHAVLRIEVRDQ